MSGNNLLYHGNTSLFKKFFSSISIADAEGIPNISSSSFLELTIRSIEFSPSLSVREPFEEPPILLRFFPVLFEPGFKPFDYLRPLFLDLLLPIKEPRMTDRAELGLVIVAFLFHGVLRHRLAAAITGDEYRH